MISCPECGMVWDPRREPRCPRCELSWEDVQAAADLYDRLTDHPALDAPERRESDA